MCIFEVIDILLATLISALFHPAEHFIWCTLHHDVMQGTHDVFTCQGTFNRRISAWRFLFLINSLFLISSWQWKWVKWHAVSWTEVIGWDIHESPSVNIVLTTKLLSHNPLSWDMDCLLTLWPLLIPCFLDNGCCSSGFLIFIIVERNSLYNSLYHRKIYDHRKIIKAPLLHQSLGPHVFLSFSLSLPPSG